MDRISYPFDAAELLKSRRAIKKELLASGEIRVKKKIAVLGGSTTNDIVAMLELFLLHDGIEPVFYQSEYAQYWQDAMFDNPELQEFAPDLIFIHTSQRNILTPRFSMTESAETIDAALDEEYRRFSSMWERLDSVYHCPLIQNNFEMPFFRLLGNRDAYDIHGRINFITRLNLMFYAYAASHKNFYINDINFLSASYGLEAWSDPQYWYLYKYALCVPAIPDFSYNVANIMKAIFGKNKKAIALDLDNTLWGGVVGDDGVGGIDIGHETPGGQAYTEFQEYLKAHRELGVLLTVCSKNEEENALAGLRHKDCVLHPEDFTVIKANWEDKASNIASTASMLGILPESIVFLDDNPAEREIVRDRLPGVEVPDIGTVEQYIRTVDRAGYFEMTDFSEEDLKRSEMYRENLARETEQQSFADYGEFLLNLKMVAVIRDFEPLYLQRITQLTNKSNQFNVTTKRYTENEMEAVYASDAYIRLYGRLTDKFGDNGIVSVVIGKKDGDSLHIELWLMSCRVLKRDMEFAMMDTLAEVCRKSGIRKIFGYYYPTAKNKMVKDLFSQFGFCKIREDEAGNTVWELAAGEYENKNRYIQIDREEEK